MARISKPIQSVIETVSVGDGDPKNSRRLQDTADFIQGSCEVGKVFHGVMANHGIDAISGQWNLVGCGSDILKAIAIPS